jgi:hypothetical protein
MTNDLRPTTFAVMILAGAMFVCDAGAAATVPTEQELQTRDAWMSKHWLDSGVPAPRSGLVVLANHDPVSLNGREGNPLNIAGRKYTRGVYCHAVSKVLVRLPGPGKTFTAAVGIDTNDFTSNGRGSVVFSVSVGERQLYTSKLMREGMPGEAVSVDLGGATAFTLDVGDGGDGIGCDQSDWADAKVVLADGKEVWLGDLNIIGEGVDGGPPMSFLYGGKRSSELLPAWARTCDSGKIDDTRTRHTITWTDDKTKLVVRAEVVTYRDFPTAEWTLYFRNAGDKETPILSDIRALDATVYRGPQGEFLLHHNAGSQATMDDYRPLETTLRHIQTLRLATGGGRGSDGVWPYFNVLRRASQRLGDPPPLRAASQERHGAPQPHGQADAASRPGPVGTVLRCAGLPSGSG